MANDLNQLNTLHFDVLCEIGNIGSGNAITALSALVGRPVSMTVPKVKLLEFKEYSDILGDPESIVVGILVSISGDVNGIMMFMLKPESARTLINHLMGLSGTGSHSLAFSEMDLSAIQEIGNILCSSYINALAALIGKTIKPSPPMLAQDMAAAILSVPAIEFGKIADHVLFIDSVFQVGAENASGYFLLVPDMQSFNTILSSLGVM